MKRVLLTVTGPTASGKTELVKVLSNSGKFEKLVSTTTRPIRPGEIHGQDYYFSNDETFDYLEKSDQIVQQVTINGKRYGTTVDEVERVFKNEAIPVIIVEPYGVGQLKGLEEVLDIKVYSLFIEAPLEILRSRYLSRVADQKNLSDYDKLRLEAIDKEFLTWLGKHEWDFRVSNSEDDLSTLEWISKSVYDQLSVK